MKLWWDIFFFWYSITGAPIALQEEAVWTILVLYDFGLKKKKGKKKKFIFKGLHMSSDLIS